MYILYTSGGHYPVLVQVVYIAYTPLGKKWRLCTRRLAYILHESWLFGVFRIYTTLKPRPSDVCSPLQTSFGLGSGRIYVRGIHRITMIYILHMQLKIQVQYVLIIVHVYFIPLCAQSPLSLDCCLSPASSLMALSSTGYHQENPMEDQCMRLSMEQTTPTSLQWTLGVETPTTT